MQTEIKLEEKLKNELLELCEKYSAHPGKVIHKISEYHSTYSEIDKDIIKEIIKTNQNELLYTWTKEITPEDLFEQSIASLIFYKSKL